MEKRFSLRLSDKCAYDLIEFAKIQSNFTDSVRYLMEKEVAQNGMRNLQEYIPLKRTKSYYENENGDL